MTMGAFRSPSATRRLKIAPIFARSPYPSQQIRAGSPWNATSFCALSIHAGMVIVADGTPEAGHRLERVLTYDPGMGIIRHADAGYDRAIGNAGAHGIRIPMGPRPK